MSFSKVIDDGVLKLCTAIAHTIQRVAGKTNFFLAKIGILIASIHVTFGITNYFHPFMRSQRPLFIVVLYALYLLSILLTLFSLDEADERALNSEKVATPFVTGRSSLEIRILWLAFACFDTVITLVLAKGFDWTFLEIIYNVSFSYGLVIFYYFIAVEPLRPRKSKVRQWLDNLSLSGGKPIEIKS